MAFAPDVSIAEIVAVTPSAELTPQASDYTGYMGNWGNTMDRWYQRAAIVIWPRSRAFALEAKGAPLSAVGQILDTFATDPDEARAMVTTLLRFWPQTARLLNQATLLPSALRLASQASDRSLANALLEPFAIHSLAPSDAPALLTLVDQYGPDWLNDQVGKWFKQRLHHSALPAPERVAWVTSSPNLISALMRDSQAQDSSRACTARALLKRSWDWLNLSLDQAATIPGPTQREAAFSNLAPPLLGILRSAAIAGNAVLLDEVVDTVTRRSTDFAAVLADLSAAASELPADQLRDAGIDRIARSLAHQIDAALNRAERAPDDWSITSLPNADCCADCTRLTAFLESPDEIVFTWPLAKPRRQHIQGRVDQAELPVTHKTLRQGSPHKLVLTKTDELFRAEALQRNIDRARLDVALRLLDRVSVTE